MLERPDLPHYQDLLQTLRKDDETEGRVKFVKACLVKLGLELGNGSAIQPRLTALHVTALYPDEVQELAYTWEEILSKKGDDAFIRAENDTFRVLLPDSGASAWPSEANVAAPSSSDHDDHYGHKPHQPFSTSMLIDLCDRALRYPKLRELMERVASDMSTAADREVLRAILVAVANHEEEDDEAGKSAAFTAVSLTSLSVDRWKEAWRTKKASFDHVVDTVYKAVGRTLLGREDDVPILDADMRQEMWSSLVHSWEDIRRRQEEEEAENEDEEEKTDIEAGRRLQLVDEVAGDDADDGTVKKIVVYEGGWPSKIATFNYGTYYRALAAYRDALPDGDFEWGNQLMYAKVTTSTNTLLEKNPKLLATLPTGFTVTATRQLAARGRGSNVWLAPEGQLILSTVINHPLRFPGGNRPVVFVQYIAAIAIVEAIHNYAPGFDALDVRLKWPNDIYALDTTDGTAGKPSPANYVKIGGILSYCSFQNGAYQVVLGIGLNAVNKRPTTSLEALIPEALRQRMEAATATSSSSSSTIRNSQLINNERLLACMLVRLEALYKKFCRQGFAGELERLYYRHWLHTNQVVTLEAVQGMPQARILGVTTDWGLLHAAEVANSSNSGVGDGEERLTGRVWKLQSDENSFDYWKGLVRTKA